MNLYKHKNKLIFILLLITILPYFYISFYCNPIADDFSYAFKGKNNPLIITLISEYLNWNGRYISNIFVLLNPITFNSFIGYKIVPILLILLTFFSINYFIKTITKEVLQNAETIVFSFLITLLYLYQMPVISEGIYWYTAAVTYQLGNISFIFYLTFITNFLKGRYILNHKYINILLLAISIFFTIGFNEIMMITIVLFHTILFAIFKLNNLKNKKWVFLLLILSLLFGSLMYFAPGNSVREQCYPNNHRVFHTLFFSLFQSFKLFFIWSSSIPLLLMSILYYPISKRLSKEISIFKKSFYLNPAISFALLFIVIFIGVFPIYWSAGTLYQQRSINVTYFLFIFIWFINLTVLYNYNLIFYKLKNQKIVTAFQLLIWGSLIFTKNGYKLIDDIKTGNHKYYNSQMISRYEKIKNDGNTIYFEPIKNKPNTLFITDITNDTKNWKNRGYCNFFDVPNKTVELIKSNEDN